MAGLRWLLALAGASFSRSVELDLSNWIGQLTPILQKATVLDLSLPGAHDTMTFDLSNTISEGYEGMGPVISKILHSVTPLLAGRFIREQGQTQGLSITQMLDSGIRFIDFRIMFTDAPSTLRSSKDWYNLHGCQSEHPALTYLKQVRTWLDAHPKEILVFWASRHGDRDLNGTDQYPSTTPQERQQFFAQVSDTFKGMLFDASKGRLNETSIEEMWSRGQRVVWYATDYEESTNSSPLALDSMLVDNQCPGGGWESGALNQFRKGGAAREADKARNQFLLVSMTNDGGKCNLEWASVITFVPLAKELGAEKKCMACYAIPNFGYCPMSLQEQGQLSNYYNQRVLEAIYKEGASNPAVDFPNAIYIDGIDLDGRIRTGTQRLNPLLSQSDLQAQEAAGDHETDGYAYVATLVGATARRLCRGAEAHIKGWCEVLMASIEEARARHPVTLWDDAVHGRLSNWPTMPPAGDPTTVQVLI